MLHLLCSCSYLFTFLLYLLSFHWHIRMKPTAYFFEPPCIWLGQLPWSITTYHLLICGDEPSCADIRRWLYRPRRLYWSYWRRRRPIISLTCLPGSVIQRTVSASGRDARQRNSNRYTGQRRIWASTDVAAFVPEQWRRRWAQQPVAATAGASAAAAWPTSNATYCWSSTVHLARRQQVYSARTAAAAAASIENYKNNAND